MDKMYLKQLYIHVSVQQKYTTTTEIRNQNDINVTLAYKTLILGSNLQKIANKSGTILSGFRLHYFHFVNTDSYPSKFLRILI